MTTLGLAALAFLLGPAAAHAQNIVQDGGFEAATTGIYNVGSTPLSFGDGWTLTQGNAIVYSTGEFKAYPGVAHSGQIAVGLPSFGGVPTLSQTLTTKPGAAYTLSFYAAGGTMGSTLLVGFGSQSFTLPVPDYGTTAPADYSFYSLDLAATTASTPLTFTAMVPSSGVGIQLDDVSVSANAPVPEASSMVSFGLMLALGLGGMIVARRKSVKA